MKPFELVALLREREARYARELPGLPLQRRTILLRVPAPIGWEPSRPWPPTLHVTRLTTGRVLGRLQGGMLLAEFVLDELLDAALDLAVEGSDVVPICGEPTELEIQTHEVLRPPT